MTKVSFEEKLARRRAGDMTVRFTVNEGRFSSAATKVISGDIFFSYGPLEVAAATQLRETLLHEMCHTAVSYAMPGAGEEVPGGHGPRWRAEMQRVCPEQLAPFDAVLKELAMSS